MKLNRDIVYKIVDLTLALHANGIKLKQIADFICTVFNVTD